MSEGETVEAEGSFLNSMVSYGDDACGRIFVDDEKNKIIKKIIFFFDMFVGVKKIWGILEGNSLFYMSDFTLNDGYEIK